MSSSSLRFTKTTFVLFAALFLAGCFRPMYGGVEGSALRSELAAIQIDPIQERAGYYLANELRFALNGTGDTVQPKYRLQINLRERVQTSLVDTISQRATAGSVVMDADYKLTAIDGGAPIISGVAFTFSSYDRTSQRFANIRAARDAEIRDAKNLAEQIKTRISAALVK